MVRPPIDPHGGVKKEKSKEEQNKEQKKEIKASKRNRFL